MAQVIGGIAGSHSPTIGFALDRHKQGRSRVGLAPAGIREASRRIARNELTSEYSL